MPVEERDSYEHLVGHRFPGGEYAVPGYEAWLWSDAVLATPDYGGMHPGAAYVVGLHGGGASIQDIFDLFDADADSGVLFGEVELELAEPLVPDEHYRVEGEILAVDRKRGRKTGAFDRVRFQHRINAAGPDGRRLAAVTHTWIFPRAGS